MKNKQLQIPLLVALLALPCAGYAQSYRIPWFKIAGGGSTSTNIAYSVSGTIGQHDAGGPLTNGVFSVTGGFWAVIQTPGAPTLKIVPATPGYVTLSWSPNTPGWRLQETVGLAPANWTDSPSGTNNAVTVPINPPRKFYRLTMH
jgi:hypothetical protein